MDHIQLIADCLDVEIFAYSPDPTVTFSSPKKSKHFLTLIEQTFIEVRGAPPIVGAWSLNVLGSHHPPSRQIHLVNYQNFAHWNLLQTTDIAPDAMEVVNNTDWHLGLPGYMRRPPAANLHTPTRIHMLPRDHARYQDVDIWYKDVYHIPDGRSSNAGNLGAAHPTPQSLNRTLEKSRRTGADKGAQRSAGANGNGADKSPTSRLPRRDARGEIALAAQPRLRIIHGAAVDDPGLAFVQTDPQQSQLSLYKAFARSYYGDDARGWYRVLLRVLRLWNSVTNTDRADNLARQARHQLYLTMALSNHHIEHEVNGSRAG